MTVQRTILPGNRIENILFVVTLLLHVSFVFYISKADRIEFVASLNKSLSNLYAVTGLEWSGLGAYLVAAALFSSLILNSARRIIEGLILGWPRFMRHDKDSLIHALVLFFCYGALTYFASGYLGEKYSSRPIDLINTILIALFAYIFGFIVNFVDEVISAIYSILRKGEV